MADDQEREAIDDEEDPYYGLHQSDFTPTNAKHDGVDPHLVDKFLTFVSEAKNAWIMAGMPMDKSMALVRILHNFNFITFGRANLKMDMANVMAAYTGRDRLAFKTAERVATNTHQQMLENQAVSKLFGSAFGKRGVSPSSTGER